jgi:hypothetical protein
MKKLLYLFLFISSIGYSQTIDLSIPAISEVPGLEDSLNTKVAKRDSTSTFATPTQLEDSLSGYVDTSSNQNIEGVKTFKDVIDLRDTIYLISTDTGFIYCDGDTVFIKNFLKIGNVTIDTSGQITTSLNNGAPAIDVIQTGSVDAVRVDEQNAGDGLDVDETGNGNAITADEDGNGYGFEVTSNDTAIKVVSGVSRFLNFVGDSMSSNGGIMISIGDIEKILDPPHMYMYFWDSTYVQDLTLNEWIIVSDTGRADSLFIKADFDYFTYSGDTVIAPNYSASFNIDGGLTISAGINDIIEYRIVTSDDGTIYENKIKFGVNAVPTPVPISGVYWEADASAKIWIEVEILLIAMMLRLQQGI